MWSPWRSHLEPLSYPDSADKKEPAEELQAKLREMQVTLNTPAGSAETRAGVILKLLGDLQEIERQLPRSRTVQELRLRAHQEAAAVRDQLWHDSRQQMGGRTVGQTLGRRCQRAEEGVRLLAQAQELDPEALPALADDLSKARHRLSYLQNAQHAARAARRRRLPFYAFLGVAALVALYLLGLALDLVPLPSWLATGASTTPSLSPTASPTAILPAGHTAALTPGAAASPTTAQVAWPPTATPSLTASSTPWPTAPGETASPTLLPAPLSPTVAPSYTATATPSPTPWPTITPPPSAAPSPRPTTAPMAGLRQATPTPSPGADASPVANLTPGPAYPVPQLLQPEDIVFFSPGAGHQYTMRWQWDGTLQADEWFDVRVWQAGMPHYGIAWTRQPEYTYDLCLKGSGYFFWSVAVIRGQEGGWLADLSPEAEPRRFTASRNDQWCARNQRPFPGSLP